MPHFKGIGILLFQPEACLFLRACRKPEVVPLVCQATATQPNSLRSETNAWVYSYMLGGERFEMDGYFPQAGRHFMVGIDFKF